MNICSHLAQFAARSPAAIALIDLDAPGGRREFTYSELWTRVRRTANGLRVLGLKPGDRVALLLPNSWEYVASFLAIAAAGLVAVPMNIRLLQDELLHMMQDSGARLLIAHEALLAERSALAAVPDLGVVVVRPSPPLERGRLAFEALAADAPIAPSESEPGELFSLMYTSGTTGLPKGVMLSHGAWNAVSDYTRHYLDYAGGEVTLHVAPLTHGAGFLLLPTLAAVGTNVICSRFDPARTLKIFREERISNGFFVPSMIRMLLDEPEPKGDSKRALRTLYYAGSPIDPETLRGAMERFGDVLVQSFAQMESPMFLTVLDRADHRRIQSGEAPHLIRSAGRPVRNAEVKVVDDGGRELPTGEAGVIVANSPQRMLGYRHRPDATAEAIRDGWLHTGDVGRFDSDGYLYVVDRKKDMVISGGANVYAREVEEVLLAMNGVRETAVIGLPHPKWGEMVTAVLVASGAERPSDDEIQDFCRTRLADYRRPKRYIWIEALPRNAYGKVLKRQLRERFAQVEEHR